MKNRIPYFLLLLLAFSFIQLSAQGQSRRLALGQWREHIPFNKAISVTDGPGKVFCAVKVGMFSYSREDGEINLYSRLNGLSDYEITAVRSDPSTGVLLIAYQTSNIDLLFPDNTIINLSDIKRKNIVGGKRINHILFINNKAYLSCEFGIVVVDISRREIRDTYYIGENGKNVNVQGLAFNGSHLLAATDSGLYKASITDPNIFNYTAWNRVTNLYQPFANYTSTAAFDGKFFVAKTHPSYGKDTILVEDNGAWVPYFLNNEDEGGWVDSYNNYLIYRNYYKVAAYNSVGTQVDAVDINMYPDGNLVNGFLDSQDIFWAADRNNGLIRHGRSPWFTDRIFPNGPWSESVWALKSSGGSTWVASGALSGDAPNFNEKNGVYLFNGDEWKNFNRTNDPLYNTMVDAGTPSVITVAVDPSDPDHAFFGSWGEGGGVLEYRRTSGGVQIYDASNSIIKPINGLTNRVIVGGMDFDEDNNLWVIAGGNTSPLYSRKPDGSWQNYIIPNSDMARYGLYQLLIDDFNNKWFIARDGASSGQGLGVFHENDPNNPNDNSFRRITTESGNGGLPDAFINSMAKDKDGAIWIGSNKGVAVIYNPGNVFSGGSFDAQRIIIEQDGRAQYLLETEFVTAVAVDGANRKWFGTEAGGVFFTSADGTKQLLNFNTDNSPLPSNKIKTISIDEITGEVFFGTDNGIVSYGGDATEGGEVCDAYYVFPNPVRHDYTGPIAIRGLVTDADVKITDIAGNIVYHTKANGGLAVWNGTNFRGEKVQTGIYTVLITNSDGSQTCATKLLFAN